MFKKFLASVGVGAAKVDTQLEKNQFVPGEDVRGRVVIKGGDVEQSIDSIHMFLMTEAVREVDEKKVKEKVALEKYLIADNETIGAGETKEIPFVIQMPFHAPASHGRLPIWFETGLDIPMALDPGDRDPIKIAPHPSIQKVIEALESIGFHIRKVDMEVSKRHGYVQEFEFVPNGEYRSYLDELEVIFFLNENKLDVMLEVDRRARGLKGLFSEALEMDESIVKVSFDEQELQEGTTAIAGKLRTSIDPLKQ
ncbi:sporulation protein [Halobacillus sp. ACCC02827]|uniref:sporulation protein n=1 Tax=Bacillaceae TaxID=186817 RepID=UPI0002A4DD9A|nr:MULTISPECIES: sporulation protein [Bacillaceae]ELK46003.1 sporulation control protein [Halobacillus sp. BAB-2008]QHT46229.1 sporulation protein [Bacillus sp. SB49]WJE17048.1 sporulation protein [Halobacillus sp. ACCC02827]